MKMVLQSVSVAFFENRHPIYSFGYLEFYPKERNILHSNFFSTSRVILDAHKNKAPFMKWSPVTLFWIFKYHQKPILLFQESENPFLQIWHTQSFAQCFFSRVECWFGGWFLPYCKSSHWKIVSQNSKRDFKFKQRL